MTIKENEVPIATRLYIRAKHHYANHTFEWEKREDERITCKVYDKEGILVYHYFYPEIYYVTMNEELDFNNYEKEWLGI